MIPEKGLIAMARIPVLPNIITAIGLTFGLYIIFKMNMIQAGEADLHVLTVTAAFLLLASVCDLLDGAIARILRLESPFGSFFDSISDAVTFGVAPSVIVLKSLSFEPGSLPALFMMGAALIFSVSGVLRLVRFNIMGLSEKKEDLAKESAIKHFTGLPIPAGAAGLVSLNLFLASDELKWWTPISEEARGYVLFFAMIFLGYFMISRWKFPSLKTFHFKVSSFRIVFLTVLLAVSLIAGILNHFPVTFFIVSWGYIGVAWILSIIRVIAGRRTKALEDFEPEPSDDLDL